MDANLQSGVDAGGKHHPCLCAYIALKRELCFYPTNGSQEYDKCYQTMRECVPHANVLYAPQSQESRCMCSLGFRFHPLTPSSADGVLYATSLNDASQTYPTFQVEGLC